MIGDYYIVQRYTFGIDSIGVSSMFGPYELEEASNVRDEMTALNVDGNVWYDVWSEKEAEQHL